MSLKRIVLYSLPLFSFCLTELLWRQFLRYSNTDTMTTSFFSIRIPLLTLFLTLPSLITSWTVPTQVNLAWPPLGNQGYGILDGKTVLPNGQDSPRFPCWNVPVSPAQKRVPFPITGGHFQFQTTNETGALPDHQFVVHTHFGQISADEMRDQPRAKSSYESTDVFKDFGTGSVCSPDESFGPGGVNVTDGIRKALFPNSSYFEPLTVDIRGMNATLGLQMDVFGPSIKGEDMYQCAYVTFVSWEEFKKTSEGGICNGGRGLLNGTTGGGVAIAANSTTAVSSLTMGSTARKRIRRHI
jgi:hypothetical protein